MEDLSEAALIRLRSRRERIEEVMNQLRELLSAIDADIIAARLQMDADRVSAPPQRRKDDQDIDTPEE